MRPLKLPVLIFPLLFSLTPALFTPVSARNSIKPDYRGLLAGWGTYSRGDTTQGQLGFRFLPEFALDIRLGGQKLLLSPLPITPSAAINIKNQTNPPAPGTDSHQSPDSLSLTASRTGLFDKQDSQTNKAVINSSLCSAPVPLTFTRTTNTKTTQNNHAPEKPSLLFISPETSSSSFISPEIETARANSDNTLANCPETEKPAGTSPYQLPSRLPSRLPSQPPSQPPFQPPHSAPAASLSGSPHLTAELSLNIWGTLTVQRSQENEFRSQIKPYRLSLKYSTSRFEARLGLQKISFGSATLIRPLMWFDRIDPRDPIQLTDGVYGLLLRTYISTRTNLWAWVLLGNDDPKGLEFLGTEKRRPEFGARAQVPAGKGALAFSIHQRQGRYDSANPAATLIPVVAGAPPNFNFPEIRLAADGKWDLGIGLWFEATLTNQHSPHLLFRWQRALTLGLDYTFAVGNGLHLLGEYFQSDMSKAALAGDTFPLFRSRFLAASASYPLTPLDHFSAIAFFDTRNNDLYSFVRWQRSYDRWSINLMAFWNPKEYRIFAAPPTGQANLFAGQGLQLMLLYNF